MNKKLVIFFVGTCLVIVACGLATKTRDNADIAYNNASRNYGISDPKNENKDNGSINNADSHQVASGLKRPKDPHHHEPTKPVKKPITHYDTEALDNQVREMAKRLSKDPMTFRMPVRTDPDGTQIYRMLGMHVIVNPGGEEVYLPDEI